MPTRRSPPKKQPAVVARIGQRAQSHARELLEGFDAQMGALLAQG